MRAARLLLLPLAASAIVLAGCGEKVQTIPVGTERKADGKPWETTDTRFLAPGWTPGNESSWNEQLANRAQGQNDYAPRK